MIIVNNPGDWGYVYTPLAHADWNGCTLADLVFPFFLFIVGISITLSMPDADEKYPHTKTPLLRKITRRTFLLFLFGLFLNGFPYFDLSSIRVLGVLQRIAIVFFVGSLTYLYFINNTIIALTIFTLIGYWLLMTLVPVPGIGDANLEPGTNLAAWVDQMILGNHVWSQTGTWDPEGILSTFPAIVTGLLGILTGKWLLNESRDVKTKIIWIFVAGSLAVTIGLAWDMAFPINKSLWTSSYVIYTAGVILLALGVSFWFMDVMNYQQFAEPFKAFGANAITAYLSSQLFAKLFYIIPVGEYSLKGWLFQNTFNPLIPSPYNASLAMSLLWGAIIFVPIWIMYKRNVIVSV